MSRYLDTLDAKVPLVGKRWTKEWLPMIRDRNEAERDVDYSAMSDAELLAKFDDMTDWMTEMWYVHGHINFALLSGAALSDMYHEVMQPDDPTESYQILQGHHTRPVDAAHGLWDLSRIASRARRCGRVRRERADESSPPGSPSPRRAASSSNGSTSTSTTSAGAATLCTTSPTCHGAKTRRSRSAPLLATSTWTTATIR